MIIFILLLAMIVISRTEVCGHNQFNRDYISIQHSNVIKGIFVILVFLGHSMQYIDVSGAFDKPYLTMNAHLGQMVVSAFLFYSGYGMMKSIISKKFNYIKEIPVKRFLVTFVNLAIAVSLYVIMNLILGIKYDTKTILLSYTGFTNIGNSNWYIFEIFILYILLFISFYLLKWLDNKLAMYIGIVIFTVLTIISVYVQMKAVLPGYYFYTTILFPLGSWFAMLQEPLEKLVMHNDYVYWTLAPVVAIAYWVSCEYKIADGIKTYTVWTVVFTLTVVLVSMKIKINSSLLEWFGKHVFSIYVLQRIPMIIMERMGFAAKSPYVFIVLSLIITVTLAMIFDYFTGIIDKQILRKLLRKSQK